jgi:WD40 repeat protein
MPTGSWLASLEETHEQAVGALAMAPSGEFMVSAGFEGNVAIWSIPGWARANLIKAGTSGVSSVSIHPNERLLAVTSEHNVSIFSVETGELVDEAKLEAKGVYSVHFSSDGRWLAVAAADKKVRVWDVSDLD